MLCIKTVKSLSYEELHDLITLIDTFYDKNTLLQNEIVIYKKIGEHIIGCICVNPKTKNNDKTLVCLLCSHIEYWNMNIEINLIDTAKNISGTSLIVKVDDESKWYYAKYGFIWYNDNTMILQK